MKKVKTLGAVLVCICLIAVCLQAAQKYHLRANGFQLLIYQNH